MFVHFSIICIWLILQWVYLTSYAFQLYNACTWLAISKEYFEKQALHHFAYIILYYIYIFFYIHALYLLRYWALLDKFQTPNLFSNHLFLIYILWAYVVSISSEEMHRKHMPIGYVILTIVHSTTVFRHNWVYHSDKERGTEQTKIRQHSP